MTQAGLSSLLSARNVAIVRVWLRARAAGSAQATIEGLRSVLPPTRFAIALPVNAGGVDSAGRVPV